MSELLICIMPNLLVYQFVTELFGYNFCYFIIIFRLKYNIHKHLIINIRLLMNIEQVGKLVDSRCQNLFGIQVYIYRNLKLVLCKFYDWKLHYCHNFIKSSSS